MDAAFTSCVAISLRAQSFMSLVPVHKIFFEDTEYLFINFIIGFIYSQYIYTKLQCWKRYGLQEHTEKKIKSSESISLVGLQLMCLVATDFKFIWICCFQCCQSGITAISSVSVCMHDITKTQTLWCQSVVSLCIQYLELTLWCLQCT